MKNINGQGNEITIILPHKKIDCISSHHEQFNQIIHQSHIIITGNNNHVSMHFDSEENVESLLLNEGFLLIIKENDNTVNLGTIILRYSNILEEWTKTHHRPVARFGSWCFKSCQ